MAFGVVGLGAVIMCSLFWGSNFVVIKKYDMGDGMHFQFLMSLGVLFVGIITAFASPQVPRSEAKDFDSFPLPDYMVTLSFEGLLGGIVWSLGNLLTVPILKRLGLGLGYSIWSGTSIIVSWLFGRMTVFGLVAEPISTPTAALSGLLLGVCALAIFTKVESKVVPKSNDLYQPLFPDFEADAAELLPQGRTNDQRKGILLAVIAGLLYGFQFVPLQIHNHQYEAAAGVSPILVSTRFFFSQFLGSFLVSFMSFVIYLSITRNKAELVDTEAVLPSILCGLLWSMGAMFGMVATAELGLTIGFPLMANACFLVNGFWSCVVFKEIQGKRNLRLFALAGLFSICSCLSLGLSNAA